MASIYREEIRRILAREGFIGIDPAHVEAWMRLEHSTLDGLSGAAFRREVMTSAKLAGDAPAESVELARSYGLGR